MFGLLALVLSAVVMSGSFLVASIASDLRYHLWSMIAVALALAIGAGEVPGDRRRGVMGVVAAVAAITLAGHALAPPMVVPLPPKPLAVG